MKYIGRCIFEILHEMFHFDEKSQKNRILI